MRTPLLFGAAAFLLLNACSKELSCYRDMIVGTWVEQTFDGQAPATHLRSVHFFERSDSYAIGRHSVKRMVTENDQNRTIGNLEFQYLITCKIITDSGSYMEEEIEVYTYTDYEVLRFTDTTLRVRVVEALANGQVLTPAVNEITYKKVSAENANAKTIQNLWELASCSVPDVPSFRIRFLANGSYAFYLKTDQTQKEEGEEGAETGAGEETDEGEDGGEETGNVEVWVEKSDETGKYEVYDSFIMTQFFNNPVFGTPEKRDVACWELMFAQEEKEMVWRALEVRGDERIERSFSFILVEEE